jgi:hypothetical protein
MIVGVLSAAAIVPRIYSQLPYVWAIAFVYDTTALYWTTVFGAPAEFQLSPTQVTGVTVNDVIYTETASLADCQAFENSFYFDVATQELFIHLDHDTDGMTARVNIGEALGFTDNTVLDIGGIEYLPLIASIPSLSRVQDLVKYDKLALINGERSIRDMARVLVEQRLMSPQEAESNVRLFLARLHEESETRHF